MFTHATHLRRLLGRVAPLCAALVLGCTAQPSGTGTTPNGPSGPPDVGTTRAGLIAVQSCGELEEYIENIALAELEAVQSSGYGHYGVDVAIGAPAKAGDAASAGGTGAEPPTSPSGGTGTGAPAPQASDPGTTGSENGGTPTFSGTNNQVTGVDEADIVKTDGNFVYVTHGASLLILKSNPPGDAQLVGQLALGTTAEQMFLFGDRVAIYGRRWASWDDGGIAIGGGGTGVGGVAVGGTTPPPATEPASPPSSGSGSAGSSGSSEPDPGKADVVSTPAPDPTALRGEISVYTLVDVADRTSPKILRTLEVEGGTVAARMIGGTVYTVLRGQIFLPSVGWGMPVSGGVAVGVGVAEPAQAGGGSAGSAGAGAATPDAGSNGSTDEPPPEPKADSAAEPPTDTGTATAEPMTTAPAPGDPVEAVDPMEAYKALLAEKTLQDYLPRYKDTQGDVVKTGLLAECGSFYKPSVQMGLSVLSILSLDLTTGTGSMSVTSTLGNAETVYASKDAIYVASYVYGYWFWNASVDQMAANAEFSLVHKFAIDGAATQYAGSAKIPGQLLNQFSMDEHEGYLRAATTRRTFDGTGAQTSGVVVLGQGQGELVTVGSVDGLAEGERIYSARFIGNRGFIVTFRQTDPLFTMDLSNPADPKVVGELKIPGFSTYIHPMGENHLLTIGQEAEDNGQWVQIKGVQVQIFDVSDLSAPALVHKATVGGSGFSSEALYEHKAFSYFPTIGLLAIPFSDWSGGGGMTTVDPGVPSDGGGATPGDVPPSDGTPTPDPAMDPDPETPPADAALPPEAMGPKAGVMVFTVDAVAGIGEKGTISHDDLLPTAPDWMWREATVRRTLLIEGHLFTVGTLGMKVNRADDLSEVAKVAFPAMDSCDYYGYCGGEPGKPVPMPTTPADAGGGEVPPSM